MELYLLRHAIAVDREKFDGEDSERPLTIDGEKKMRRIANGIRALKLSFDVILSSPYRRAQETAGILAVRFNIRRHVRLTDALAPRGNKRTLIAEIAALGANANSIVLVGHEPYLSTLAATLVSGGPSLGLILKKGGLCKLVLDEVRFGRCAEIEWLLTPRQLIALAD
ncbi:MAG TPA: phosphohistidine phosphatase SixA [Methylomirabilota bacterium]|nr:phosphohistidine phosphatase SixA [Methylomirabilota bacterium]